MYLKLASQSIGRIKLEPGNESYFIYDNVIYLMFIKNVS